MLEKKNGSYINQPTPRMKKKMRQVEDHTMCDHRIYNTGCLYGFPIIHLSNNRIGLIY